MRKMAKTRLYKGIFSFILCMLLVCSLIPAREQTYAEASNPFVVMLDPGHGGSDGGAVRGDNYERIFNEKLADACRAELVQYDNVLVYVTREYDTDITTYARSMYAKRVQADLFVSFHINANDDSSAKGAEIYVPHGNWKPDIAVEARNLANRILENFESLDLPGYGLANNHLKNRGVKTRLIQNDTRLFYPDGSKGDYYEVIRMGIHNNIPSMIIEHAFISNPAELAMLRDDAALKKLGKATAQAIVAQYGLTKTGKTLKQTVLKDQTSVVNIGKTQTAFTVGSKPYTLTASGGTGTGEYVFYSNNPKVVRIEGNQAYIVGAGDVRISVTKYEDDTYLPRSLPDINRPSVKVSPIETQLKLSVVGNYRGENNTQIVVLSCTPAAGTEYGAVPYGKVTFYKDNAPIGTAQFGEDGTCTMQVTGVEPGACIFTATYQAGEFDGFDMRASQAVSYVVEATTATMQPSVSPAPSDGTPENSLPTQNTDLEPGEDESEGAVKKIIIIAFAVAGVIIVAAIVILAILRFRG